MTTSAPTTSSISQTAQIRSRHSSRSAATPRPSSRPQDLTRGSFADSPTGGYYQDSSSESASSKRTGSSTSSKTAVNAAITSADAQIDDLDCKMEWGTTFTAFPDDDSPFEFGRDQIDGMYNFEHDDHFFDRTAPFEASSSPDRVTAARNSITSPTMPTAKAKSSSKEATPKKKSQSHHKALSQYSVSSAMNGLKTSTSREVSPMSMSNGAVLSQGGSPAAMFTSPSPPRS
ncbi:SPT3 Dosage dependent suppressor of Ty-induced promoter mutations-like protein [Fusarium falciforme]